MSCTHVFSRGVRAFTALPTVYTSCALASESTRRICFRQPFNSLGSKQLENIRMPARNRREATRAW